MGIVVLPAIGLYLLISVAVAIGTFRYARKHSKNAKLWGCSAALVMYLLVFWDHIPTLIAHKYYCEKEAGFWVYKTVDQWKVENPGVMETLVNNKGAPSQFEVFDDGHGDKNTYLLNGRFNWVVIKQDMSGLLSIIRTEQEVKDTKKNEILARYVDFSAGNSVKNTVGPPGPLKFWLSNRHCSDGGYNQDALRDFRNNFMGAEK